MQVQLGDYFVEIAESFGPRITGLRRGDGPDLFVRLDDMSLPHPERPYVLAGGHRLWAAPEEPEVTYWPDDAPVTIDLAGDDVTVSGHAGPYAKSISLRMDRHGLVVRHSLQNVSDVTRRAASWGITQLVSGGTAVLPLGSPAAERQAAATLVTWPYTRFDDPAWTVDGTTAVISGTREGEFKVGTPLEGRTMAYLVGTSAFCKTSPTVPGTYPDRGASGQIYVNAHFVELEALGPLHDLEPGASTSHDERWWMLERVGSIGDLRAQIE